MSLCFVLLLRGSILLVLFFFRLDLSLSLEVREFLFDSCFSVLNLSFDDVFFFRA